jgi:RNA polymerase sigma factor (sigma-70 family)
MLNDDLILLRQYSRNNSEDAFAALVSRHVNLVYSVALRSVRDVHLAGEITQAVFIILARKADSLGDKIILSGWLCRTARYAGANALKIQMRRQRREQEAYMESILNEAEPAETWDQIAPLLDGALEKLGQKDHDALVLRFFENKTFAEVGASLGASEDAAKMRVSRALEKLRKFFTKRGVSSTTTIIAGTISANSVQAAPVALAKSVTAVAIAKGAAASGSTLTLIKGALKIMAWTKAKTAIVAGVAVILAAATSTIVIHQIVKKNPTSWGALKNPELIAQLKSFVAEKRTQANAAGNEQPREFKAFFAAAQNGDWLAVSNQFEDLRKRAPQYLPAGSKSDIRLHGIAWETVTEIWGAFDNIFAGQEKYPVAYASDIINSIPPGSIYFGGTDPGRLLITGMEKSEVNADPFFLLTQNALADGTYLDYLQSMYGDNIYITTHEDAQKCFQDYTEDARRRLQNHQLKPDENVKLDSNGQIQVSGQVAVMAINGLLAKVIFDKNTNREFYVEESFPLDWMYPYLEPHNLIFKINRQPLSKLSDESIQRDHDYWKKYVTPLIGDWLNDDTSVQEVTQFDEKVFLRHDFSGFTGDPNFVQNDYASRMFSHERSNIADLYVWRMNHAASADEKERMAREADFAFRQALALCPSVKGNVSRYTDFLKGQHRDSDAALVNEMARQFPNLK